jgi:hypothetical protein
MLFSFDVPCDIMSYYWTTPFFALVLIFFIHNAYADPIQADNTNKVEIINPHVQPPIIKVGDTFSVTATIVNNSPNPIYYSNWCSDLFPVIFDSHVMIEHKESGIACPAVVVINSVKAHENITSTSPYFNSVYRATEAGTANATVTFSYFVKNQTEISTTISKSFLFTIYDNNTGIKTINETELSPLRQMKNGILPHSVVCESGYVLVKKMSDPFTACMSQETANKIVNRGWGKIIEHQTALPMRIGGMVQVIVVFKEKPTDNDTTFIKHLGGIIDSELSNLNAFAVNITEDKLWSLEQYQKIIDVVPDIAGRVSPT